MPRQASDPVVEYLQRYGGSGRDAVAEYNRRYRHDEPAFRAWYADWAKKADLDPDPDHPLHKYDYRAAYRTGAVPQTGPDKRWHWPSQFKADDHPTRFVAGVDTKKFDSSAQSSPPDVEGDDSPRRLAPRPLPARIAARPRFRDLSTMLREADLPDPVRRLQELSETAKTTLGRGAAGAGAFIGGLVDPRHTVETVKGVAGALAQTPVTAARYLVQEHPGAAARTKERFGFTPGGERARERTRRILDMVRPEGAGEVSEEQGASAALQLAALGLSGPLGSRVAGLVGGAAAPLSARAYAARALGGAAGTAPVVAAYDEDDPGRGAVAGSILGALGGIARPVRVRRQTLADQPEQLLGTGGPRPTPRTARAGTARVTEEAPPPEAPYEVESIAETFRKAMAARRPQEPSVATAPQQRQPVTAPAATTAPVEGAAPTTFYRIGPVEAHGAFFAARPLSSQLAVPYEAPQDLNLADLGDPAIVRRIAVEASTDTDLDEAWRQTALSVAREPAPVITKTLFGPWVAKTIAKLGYDGARLEVDPALGEEPAIHVTALRKLRAVESPVAEPPAPPPTPPTPLDEEVKAAQTAAEVGVTPNGSTALSPQLENMAQFAVMVFRPGMDDKGDQMVSHAQISRLPTAAKKLVQARVRFLTKQAGKQPAAAPFQSRPNVLTSQTRTLHGEPEPVASSTEDMVARGMLGRTVFKGDEAEYTGNAPILQGKQFYEIRMLEGANKGALRVVVTPPGAATTLEHGPEVAAQAPVEQQIADRDESGGVRPASAQPETAADRGGAPVSAQPAPSEAAALASRPVVEGVEGRETEVFFSSGKKLKTTYRVVNAADLQASHDPATGFQPNPLYPESIQGRAYHGNHGTAARQQVEVATGTMRPEVVLDVGSGITDGPPLVTSHGIVVAGNQRAMMLKGAARQYPEVYATYRAELEKRAAQFGITADALAGMESPVLVRQIADESVDVNDPEQLAALNQLSDQTATKTKDQISAAMSRAKMMQAATGAINHLAMTMQPDESLAEYLSGPDGRELVRALVKDGVISSQELPRFVNVTTSVVTNEGKLALEDMLYATAIGDGDIMAKMPKWVRVKLKQSIPSLIITGEAGEYSLQPDIQQAINLLFQVDARKAERRREKTLGLLRDNIPNDQFGVVHFLAEEAERPTELFAGERTWDKESSGVDLARYLESKTGVDIAESMRLYAKGALVASRASQSEDMFGENPKTPDELRKQIFQWQSQVRESTPSYGDKLPFARENFAAIRVHGDNDKVFRGADHMQADVAKNRAGWSNVRGEDGFILKNGDFVTRDEASEIFRKARMQILNFGEAHTGDVYRARGEKPKYGVMKVEERGPKYGRDFESRRLQQRADEEGIEVRAAGRNEPATLPSDPEIQLGLMTEEQLNKMNRAWWRDMMADHPADYKALLIRDRAALDAEIERRVDRGTVHESDLFGYEAKPEQEQKSLFGGKEGTVAARNLAQTERAARNELVKLRQQLAAVKGLVEQTKLSRRIAELEKLVNRDKAITSTELATRARAERDPILDALVLAPDEAGAPEHEPSPEEAEIRRQFEVARADYTDKELLRLRGRLEDETLAAPEGSQRADDATFHASLVDAEMQRRAEGGGRKRITGGEQGKLLEEGPEYDIDASDRNILRESGPTYAAKERFYSRLERAIEAAPFEKGTPDQWRARPRDRATLAAAIGIQVSESQQSIRITPELKVAVEEKGLRLMETAPAYRQRLDLFNKALANPEGVEAKQVAQEETKIAFGSEAQRDEALAPHRALLPIVEARLAAVKGAKREQRMVDVRGLKIRGIEGFARVAELTRDPQIEQLGMMFLKSSEDVSVIGELAAQHVVTSGALDFVQLGLGEGTTLDRLRRWVYRNIVGPAKRFGVTKVAMYHNHPSGKASSSTADLGVTVDVASIAREAGIEVIGHVVIDHGTYSWIEVRGNLVEPHNDLTMQMQPQTTFRSVGEGERVFSQVEHLAEYVAGSLDPKATTFVIVDAQMRAVAVEPRREVSVKTLPQWLNDRLRALGARAVFIVAPEAKARELRSALTAAHQDNTPWRLDVVDIVTVNRDGSVDTSSSFRRTSSYEWDRNAPRASDAARSGTDARRVGEEGREYDAADRLAGRDDVRAGSGVRGKADEVAQTDTPEFRRWFGESVVVDEKGEPLVVYHGTNVAKPFTRFSRRRLGSETRGNASSDALAATSYLGFWANSAPLSGREISPYERDMPLYAQIENPLTFSSIELLAGYLADEASSLTRRGIDRLRDRLQARGYDGIVVEDEEFGGTSYVAFEPTQIKSATGNRGTFDPVDPSIVREEGPEYGRGAGSGGATGGPVGSRADNLPPAAGLERERRSFRPAELIAAIRAKVFPETGPVAEATASTHRRETATGLRAVAIADELLKAFGKRVGKLSRAQSVAYWDAAEHGRSVAQDPANPTEEERAFDAGNRELHRITEQFTRDLVKLGRLKAESVVENYVGRFWQVPSHVGPKDFLRSIYGRRPFEGPKSFLKHRTWPTFKEGMDAIRMAEQRIKAGSPQPGDEWVSKMLPATYNYVDSQLAKLGEIQRVISAERMLTYEQKMTRAQPVMLGHEPPLTPDGRKWGQIDREGNDPAFTIYGPPTIEMWEAVDALVYDKLQKLLDDLRIRHERKPKIGGRRMGYAEAGPLGQRIVTKFAGPEGVVAHELGHILDERYGLGKAIDEAIGKAPTRAAKRGKWAGQQVPDYKGEQPEARQRRKDLREELRQLANLRRETLERGVPATKDLPTSDRRYLHSMPEKMANMVEAYARVRERFKRVAPGVYEIFDGIVERHSELHPLRNIEPSLAREPRTATAYLGGPVVKGHWYAHPESLPVWHAALSRGIRGSGFGPIYDAIMGPFRGSTQIILGFSGFHAANIAREGVNSAAAILARAAINREPMGPAVKAAMTGLLTAPVSHARLGWQIHREFRTPGSYPVLAPVLDQMLKGGFRAQEESELFAADRMKFLKKAWLEFMEGETKGRRFWGAAKLPFDTIWAAIEVPTRVIMGWYVPWMKAAATYQTAARELERLPADISMDDLSREMGKVVKESEVRYGHVVYDNFFMDRTLKELGQLLLFAPGWTFGWIKVYTSGAWDLAKVPHRFWKARGVPPEIVGRNGAFVLASFMLFGLVNAIATFFMTGEEPEGKDFLAFRDGTVDEEGNSNRHVLPGGEMRDLRAWLTHPYRTVKHKLQPGLAFLVRWLENENYWGDMVYDPNAPLVERVRQTAKAAQKDLGTPLSYRAYEESKRRSDAGYGQAVRSFFGITPAPREFQRTPAQNQIREYLNRRGQRALTPEQAERAETRRDLGKQFEGARKAGDQGILKQLREALTVSRQQGALTRGQAQAIRRRGLGSLDDRTFGALLFEEALDVYTKYATPDERARWWPYLRRKAGSAGRRSDIRGLEPSFTGDSRSGFRPALVAP